MNFLMDVSSCLFSKTTTNKNTKVAQRLPTPMAHVPVCLGSACKTTNTQLVPMESKPRRYSNPDFDQHILVTKTS